jgi:flavin-dependent dehydrogenase
VTERTVDSVCFSLKMSRPFTRRSTDPVTFLTQRRHLDRFLVEQAVRTGVTFHDGEAAAGLEELSRSVMVRTTKASYEASAVIGADGANGVVARLAGMSGMRDVAVALEGNVPAGTRQSERWRRTIGMDLGGIPGGYGWLFPKEDHLNVGVGGWQYLGSSLRPRLSALCSFYGVDETTMFGLRGHHLPVRRAGAPLARGRVALVGDAAGLLDPLSGEGIYAAFYSGKAVARCVGDLVAGDTGSLTPYAAQIESELMPDLVASRRFQDAFYLVPGLYVGFLRHSDRIWRMLADLIRGKEDYAGFKRNLGPLELAVDALSFATHHSPLGKLAGLPR